MIMTLITITMVILILAILIMTIMKTINTGVTPSPPTKSFPTRSPRVELSGRLPKELYGHENSHPLELRVCLSQTLWKPNS